MNIDRNKILKMVGILALLCLTVYGLTTINKKNSMTLQEYAEQNPQIAYQESEKDTETVSENTVTSESDR